MANGRRDGSSSGEAGVRSGPVARFTATPPSATGSAVPFAMRTVTRRAGPERTVAYVRREVHQNPKATCQNGMSTTSARSMTSRP